MIACPTPTNIQVTGRKPMELPFSHQNRTVMLTALHSEHFWGLPTSLFILVCHSVTRRSTSSCYTSSERGLKYLSYYAKCLYIVLQISLYKHQSYSYPPRPRTIGEHGCFYYSIMRNGKEKKNRQPALIHGTGWPVWSRKRLCWHQIQSSVTGLGSRPTLQLNATSNLEST